MRVLVTWGSTRGGTEGIARLIGDQLLREGLAVEVLAPREAERAGRFDAVIVGGALYANRWHPDARRFVNRRARDLRRVPVWFFSSGPLDGSADRAPIPPTRGVAALMMRVGAQGHVTFGGRLDERAQGLAARAMARTHAGDWRQADRVRAWASEIARALPFARPGAALEPPGSSLVRLALYALAGWSLCAATMTLLLMATSLETALVLHAIAAPIVFSGVAWRYFAVPGARTPLATAFTFAAATALLDLLVVSGLIQRSVSMFASVGGTWLPLGLIVLATWATGTIRSMMPGTTGRLTSA